MNLIQIKQIDGLTTTLNALAKGLFDLEEEVSGQFLWTNRIYDHLEIVSGNSGDLTQKHINIFTNGEGSDIFYDNEQYFINDTGNFNNIKLNVEDGNAIIEGNLYAAEIHANEIIGNITGQHISGDDMVAYNYYARNDRTGRNINLVEKIFPRVKTFDLSHPYPTYLEDDDQIIIVENDSANTQEFDIHLPSNPEQGQKVLIKIDGTGVGQVHKGFNTYHICPAFEYEKIDGNLSWAITGNYGYAEFMYHGVAGHEWMMLRSSPGAFDIKYNTEPNPNLVNTAFELLNPKVEHVLAQNKRILEWIPPIHEITLENQVLSKQNADLIAINSGLLLQQQQIIDSLSGFHISDW